MAISQAELDSCRRFVTERTNSESDVDLSLEDCLRRWRQQRERGEVVSDVLAGVEDEEAGRMRPLKDIEAEIRQELGLSK
jgi:hypothetical protein